MDILEKFIRNIAYKFPKGYPDMKDPNDALLLENELRDYLQEEYDSLLEGSLNPGELEKPFPPRSEFAALFKDRGEKLLDKIDKGEPIKLSKGGEIIIDKDKSKEAIEILNSKQYPKLKGLAKIFFDKDGNAYSLSNFQKTEE